MRFKAVVPTELARNRLIASYQRKYPSKTRAELIELILNSIAKDNR